MSDTEHWRGFDRQKTDALLAADSTVDRRVRRTRQVLHETLMRLTVERGYDEVSVADIAEAANVGRSTFYAHFTDKDDLLRSTAGSLKAVLVREHALSTADEAQSRRPALGFSRFLTEHLEEQHTLYSALMRGRAGPIVMDVIRHALCDIVRKELSSQGSARDIELTVQFLVGAFMSVLTWWLDRGAKEPAATIEKGFQDLALKAIGST